MAPKSNQLSNERLSRLAQRLKDLELPSYSPVVTPPLLSGWVAYDASTEPPTYWQSEEGLVYLFGIVKGGSIGLPIFQLPESLRPLKRHTYMVLSNGLVGQVDVYSDGFVTPIIGHTAWISLSGIIVRPW